MTSYYIKGEISDTCDTSRPLLNLIPIPRHPYPTCLSHTASTFAGHRGYGTSARFIGIINRGSTRKGRTLKYLYTEISNISGFYETNRKHVHLHDWPARYIPDLLGPQRSLDQQDPYNGGLSGSNSDDCIDIF